VIDAEVYFKQLLDRDATDLQLDDSEETWVAPDLDIEFLERIPALTWNVSGDGQTSNSEGLWTYIFNINCFGIGLDQAKALARAGYDVVHGWGTDPASSRFVVDGDAIFVLEVQDIDLPSRVAKAMIDGRSVVQYSGTFAIALRSA
jgi:hypothetical protein